MSELLLQTVVDKLNQLEAQIVNNGKQSASSPDVGDTYDSIKRELLHLRQSAAQPTNEMKQLSGKLDTCIALLRQPVQQVVMHHHHIAKSLVIGGFMITLIIILSVMFYSTRVRLDGYRANDFKYRSLRLKPDMTLKRMLYLEDSSYRADERKMRATIIQQEEDLRRKLELLQMATQRENEAKQLRKKAGGE